MEPAPSVGKSASLAQWFENAHKGMGGHELAVAAKYTRTSAEELKSTAHINLASVPRLRCAKINCEGKEKIRVLTKGPGGRTRLRR